MAGDVSVKSTRKCIRIMRKYRTGEATEFTRTQVGILYRGAKEGHIKVPAWTMTAIYDLAEYFGHPNDRIREEEECILVAIESALKGEWTAVQGLIDDFIEAYPDTGLKRSSRDIRFIRGEHEVWKHTEVLEDLRDNG